MNMRQAIQAPTLADICQNAIADKKIALAFTASMAKIRDD